jgi:hypothetical protein
MHAGMGYVGTKKNLNAVDAREGYAVGCRM